jgi:hypothetical protein
MRRSSTARTGPRPTTGSWISPARRGEVAAVAGDRAERLAYLFHVTPRRPVLAGTHLWARDLPRRPVSGASSADDEDPATPDEFDALVLLHMANIAEQARAPDGSPGRWLARIRDVADLLLNSASFTPPAFVALLSAFEEADETLMRRAYRQAINEEGAAKERALALTAALCPVVAEPCLWLAHLAWRGGDEEASRSWTAQARKRLLVLGTSWDKRLRFEQWQELVDAPDREPGGDVREPSGALRRSIGAPDHEAGRRRFHRYVEELASADGDRPGAIYPDLPSRPWHDPQDFPIVRHLESSVEAIRDEVLALDARRFHRGGRRSGGGRFSSNAFVYAIAYRPSSRVSLTGARSSGRFARSKISLARGYASSACS